MRTEDLNKLKQFESILKQCLMKKFGSFLPENKVSLLNNETFTVLNDLDKFKNLKTREEIQGRILRDMLDSLIDIKCQKELEINGAKVTIDNYGIQLEEELIEYYAKEVSEAFHFDINEIPELSRNSEVIVKLKECYKEGLDQNVFNSDAIKLLNKDELVDVIKTYDTYSINEYLEKNKELANNKDEQIIEEKLDRKGSIQLVDINEKKHIKYIDPDNVTHLVEVKNDKVNDFYKQKISELKPGEELNPEEFFKELNNINEEIKLTNTNDVNHDALNPTQENMIKFVDNSEKIQKEIKDNVQDLNGVMHSPDANIHVINNTNDIVYTEDSGKNIETNVIQNGVNTANNTSQQNIDASQHTLTAEEYNELCMRYANNEQLTEEEMDALKRATPDLVDNNVATVEKEGIGLKLSNKLASYGFASNASLLYIILITVFVGVFIGALIFSLVN
jgi:hypothetical protein